MTSRDQRMTSRDQRMTSRDPANRARVTRDSGSDSPESSDPLAEPDPEPGPGRLPVRPTVTLSRGAQAGRGTRGVTE
eukprot:2074468-Rhodomonas_salina.1